MSFKSYEDMEYDALFVCHVLECQKEAERLFATETRIADVCNDHYKELIDKLNT